MVDRIKEISYSAKVVIGVILALVTIIGTAYAGGNVLITRGEHNQEIALQSALIRTNTAAIGRHTEEIRLLREMNEATLCLAIVERENNVSHTVCLFKDSRKAFLSRMMDDDINASR